MIFLVKNMIDCSKCDNFYYNNDGSGACNASYEKACHRANHIFHTNPIKFAEEYLDIKLYPWQKIMLKYFLKGDKDINAKTASSYISRR